MGLLKKLFGGGPEQKKRLTAREGYALALEALKAAHPMEADGAYLCCAYTASADSNVELEGDGTCRGWHFDFFLPKSRTLYLVRVQNGKTRGMEAPWEKTRKRPIEYVYAKYGAESEQGIVAEPLRVPEDWLDSPAVTAAMREALEPHRVSGGEAALEPLTLCLPAEHLRYLQEGKAREVLRFPSPPGGCFGAICGTGELYDEDSFLLYVEAATGKVMEKHSFRFPNLFYFGTSRNW